jgi:hypothetical protein
LEAEIWAWSPALASDLLSLARLEDEPDSGGVEWLSRALEGFAPLLLAISSDDVSTNRRESRRLKESLEL